MGRVGCRVWNFCDGKDVRYGSGGLSGMELEGCQESNAKESVMVSAME